MAESIEATIMSPKALHDVIFSSCSKKCKHNKNKIITIYIYSNNGNNNNTSNKYIPIFVREILPESILKTAKLASSVFLLALVGDAQKNSHVRINFR
jgi:hypothetical protein